MPPRSASCWSFAAVAAALLGGCFDEHAATRWAPPAGDPVAESPTDPAWPIDQPLSAAFDLPPWLTLAGDGSVAVGWQSARPSMGWVELVAATDGALEVDWTAARRIDSAALGVLHHVGLVDLVPATAYRYRVHVHDGEGGGVREGVFVTPGADAWRFIHLAEFHAPSDAATVAEFADQIVGFRPHVLVESGDMVDDGGDLVDWRSYLRTSAPWISNAFLLPAHSNHVNGAGGNPHVRSLFELPDNERWYATRVGQVQFVTLDSTYTANPDVVDQPAWLAERMGAALAADGAPSLVVASWHYPACSSSYASRTASRRWVIDHFLPAFRELGALDLILTGHDKYYERSWLDDGDRSIPHVMANVGKLAPSTAGGNEPECSPELTLLGSRSLGLYQVAGAGIEARVVDELGVELDRFQIGQ